MDQQSIRTLRLLEEIEKSKTQSQRTLSNKLNISLGLVNSFIKRLTKKGYFKITTVPKNRVQYIITPKGIAEKTRLTYEFIHSSFKLYRDIRCKFREMFLDFKEKNYKRIALYGISDLTEIAFLSLQETDIKLVAIVDGAKHMRKSFFKMPVQSPENLKLLTVDKIVITDSENYQSIVNDLVQIGINQDILITL